MWPVLSKNAFKWSVKIGARLATSFCRLKIRNSKENKNIQFLRMTSFTVKRR